MYSRVVTLCAATALLAVSAALAADDKPAAPKPAPEKPSGGLQEGADLPGPFRPYILNGKYERKFHCLTNEHGLNPGVLIIAQNANTDDPQQLANLIRGLDKYIVEKPKTRLNASAVFLFNDMADVVKDDDVREVHASQVAKLKGGEPALQQVVLGLDSIAALQKAGYAISPEDQVVVVLFDELKVRKPYRFKEPLKAADVEAIMKEVEKLAPAKK
jgi:hypothetical protein